jgi:hypothetical protein
VLSLILEENNRRLTGNNIAEAGDLSQR